MISEKDKMIVEAVNMLLAIEPTSKLVKTIYFNKFSKKYFFGGEFTTDAICSIDDYIECIKEMSESKWMKRPMKRSVYVTAKVCTMVFNKPQRFIVGYNIDTFEIMVAVEYDTNASVMWSEDIKALLAIECKRLEGVKND